MKRLVWLLVAGSLVLEAGIAYREYPHAKPWMRAGYLWLWQGANRITGHDFPPPDRFQ